MHFLGAATQYWFPTWRLLHDELRVVGLNEKSCWIEIPPDSAML